MQTVFPVSMANVLDMFCTCVEMDSRILVLPSASLLAVQRKAKHTMETLPHSGGFLLCYAVQNQSECLSFHFQKAERDMCLGSEDGHIKEDSS